MTERSNYPHTGNRTTEKCFIADQRKQSVIAIIGDDKIILIGAAITHHAVYKSAKVGINDLTGEDEGNRRSCDSDTLIGCN